MKAAIPREFRAPVAALQRTVTAELREALSAAGAGRAALADEFRRRAEDYRTWHRMDEVPHRVADIAARLVRGNPDPADRKALCLAVLAALSRAHRTALNETGQAGAEAHGTPL